MFDELSAWEELQAPTEPIKTLNLYPYQDKLITGCRNALASGQKRLVAYLPTGGGKTVVAIGIVKMAQEKGKRVAFCLFPQPLRQGCDEAAIRWDRENTAHSHPVFVSSSLLASFKSSGVPTW